MSLLDCKVTINWSPLTPWHKSYNSPCHSFIKTRVVFPAQFYRTVHSFLRFSCLLKLATIPEMSPIVFCGVPLQSWALGLTIPMVTGWVGWKFDLHEIDRTTRFRDKSALFAPEKPAGDDSLSWGRPRGTPTFPWSQKE